MSRKNNEWFWTWESPFIALMLLVLLAVVVIFV